MTQSNSTDVFISYTLDDLTFVRSLVASLEESGITAYYSLLFPDPSASPFGVLRETEEAFKESRLALVVIGSLVGSYQLYEIESLISTRSEYPVIPIVLGGVGLDRIPPSLRSREAVQVLRDDDQNALNHIVKIVKHLLGREDGDIAPQPTQLSIRDHSGGPPEIEDDLPSSPQSDSGISIEELLVLPEVKRLKFENYSQLVNAASYCATANEWLSSTWWLGAMLHNPPTNSAEEFFLKSMEKQQHLESPLNLPPAFFEYVRSPRDLGSRSGRVRSELVKVLEIATQIADELGSTEVDTRHILASILSREIDAYHLSDPAIRVGSASERLEHVGCDLSELRREFLTYVRKREGGRNLDNQFTKYLVWLSHVRTTPPQPLLDGLLSRRLARVLLHFPYEYDSSHGMERPLPGTIQPGDFVLVHTPDSRMDAPSNWRQSAARYLAVVQQKTTLGGIIGDPLFLSFPLDLQPVYDQLLSHGLSRRQPALPPDFSSEVEEADRRTLWEMILMLNPEFVDSLPKILEATNQQPAKSSGTRKRTRKQTSPATPPDATVEGGPSPDQIELESADTYTGVEDLVAGWSQDGVAREEGVPIPKTVAAAPRDDNGNSNPTPTPERESISIASAGPVQTEGVAASPPGESVVMETPGLESQSPLESLLNEVPTPPPPPVTNVPGPPTATSPTSVNYIINTVFSVLPEPEPANNKVSIQVSSNRVLLWHDGQPFESPNLIGADLLPDETAPDDYGEQLFKGIIHGKDKQSTLAGYEKAKSDNNDGLIVELWIGKEAANLNAHKWEYLRDPDDKTLPLFVREKSPFYRRVHSLKKQSTPATPLKILIAICNPTTLGRETDDEGKPVNPNVTGLVKLDVAQETAIVKAALQRLTNAGVAKYEILDGLQDTPVTLNAIREKLQEGFHVLHLLGHGVVIGGSYYLVMEDVDRRHKLEPADRFKQILEGRNLRLVVLASCQSATRGTGVTLQGLGPSIVGDEIPAVIAMQDEVKVATAQLFTQYFYDDLARTGRVDQAMSATRLALYQSSPKDWQWGIPVLFMSTDNGKLLDVDEQADANLPKLEPSVKSYDQLAGDGDPTPRKFAQAIEAEARRYGAVPETVGALRAVVAPSLMTARGGEELLAQPQDRDALTRSLQKRLALNAGLLESFVSKNGARLELDRSVYRQIASALNAGKHLILIGPPGTGKTSLAHSICQYAQNQQCAAGFIPTTATADWTAFDTIGGYVPTAQQVLQFRPGKFLEAVCSGSWLVIDEINRAEIDKAFGELFTVLSGQRADLPYSVGSDLVRVLPPASNDPNDWIPAKGKGLSGYDYVVHPNWRVVATMNVYDKSSLFAMSFAFVRRFAFIDVDLPQQEAFEGLVDRWATEGAIDRTIPEIEEMLEKLKSLLKPDNALSRRALGPAIVKDMIGYIADRLPVVAPEKPLDVLGEAFLLYVTPQLDLLDRTGITEIYSYLQNDVFKDTTIVLALLRRIRSLYPHVSLSEWGS